MKHRPVSRNPFALIAAKQKLGREEADRLTDPFLACLDAAKRGNCEAAIENGLVMWVLIAQIIGSNAKNRPFYDLACAAGAALFKAAGRSRELLSLTTGEYQTLKKLMIAYRKVLPDIEVAVMVGACAHADKIVAKMQQDAADEESGA